GIAVQVAVLGDEVQVLLVGGQDHGVHFAVGPRAPQFGPDPLLDHAAADEGVGDVHPGIAPHQGLVLGHFIYVVAPALHHHYPGLTAVLQVEEGVGAGVGAAAARGGEVFLVQVQPGVPVHNDHVVGLGHGARVAHGMEEVHGQLHFHILGHVDEETAAPKGRV